MPVRNSSRQLCCFGLTAFIDTQVFTYRYFLHQWPHLCYLAFDGDESVGVVVCKQDLHREAHMRGYLAMLVVDASRRGKRIGEEIRPEGTEGSFTSRQPFQHFKKASSTCCTGIPIMQ